MRAWFLFLAGCAEKAPALGDSTSSSDTADTAPDPDPFGVACDLTVPDDSPALTSALAAAADGSTLCVRAGTWPSNLDLAGRAVLVVGEGPDRTVLDGGGLGRVASFTSGEGPGAGLQGLTLTGGFGDGGAGLTVLEGSTPTLSDLVVQGNTCAGVEPTVRGVGLYVEAGTLRDVVVRDNTCTLNVETGTKIYGTGAYVRSGADVVGLEVAENHGEAYEITGAMVAKDLSGPILGLSVHGNVAVATLSCIGGGLHLSGTTSAARALDIRGNRCTSGGEVRAAGLHVFVEGAIALENVIVAGNVAEAGTVVSGGAARFSGAVTLTQADIVGNSVSGPRAEGAAVAFDGAGHTWRNVAVYGNTSEALEGADVYTYGAAVDLAWGGWQADMSFGDGLTAPSSAAGDVLDDPLYVDVSAEDPTSWDLHLQDGSPYLDAGDPTRTDADGSPSDIGAYGGEGL